jgi:hypothetical protein
MTLVISLLTEDFVAQVSDLRLINVATGQPVGEPAAKTISWCGYINLAYSGPGVLEGRRTDQWIASVLQPHLRVDDGFPALRERATFAAAALPVDRRRLEIIGVGWSRLPPQRKPRATFFEVTNVLDRAKPPAAECRLGMEQLRGTHRLVYHGQVVPDALKRQLRRHVGRRTSARPSPGPILSHMIGALRAVAASNPAVGSEALVSYLPRSDLGRSGLLMPLSRPDWEHAQYLYVPAAGRGGAVVYGPTFVCRGLTGSLISIVFGGEAARKQWEPPRGRSGHDLA